MSSDAQSQSRSPSGWQTPTLLTVLAFLGLTISPSSQPPPAPPASQKASTPRLAASKSRWRTIEAARQKGASLDTWERLVVLDPLLRYYAPRLERRPAHKDFDGSAARAVAAESSQAKAEADPKKAEDDLRWMLNPHETHDDLTTLIFLVPDAARSGLAYGFDAVVTGLTVAMGKAGFVLDGYQIGWLDDAGRDLSLNADAQYGGVKVSVATRSDETACRLPGSILLKRPKEGSLVEHELVLVLLVPETPIRGVDVEALQASLDLARTIEENREERRPPRSRTPLRLLGPNYSGSAASIVQAIKGWKRGTSDASAPLKIEWINGAAASLNVGEIEGALNSVLHPDFVCVEHTIYGSADLRRFALQYIRKNASPVFHNNRVAVIAEETSRFGTPTQPTHSKPTQPTPTRQPALTSGTDGASEPRKGTADPDTGYELYRFTFPMQIAEMRHRYAREGGDGLLGKGRLRTEEKLGLQDEDVESKELVRPESPGFTAGLDEMRLLRVAGMINEYHIRVVWLAATDVRDSLFVGEFLRVNCPDAMLAVMNAEPAFTHYQYVDKLRGTLFATTYPMKVVANRVETLGATSKSGQNDFPTPPDHNSFGIYNAALAHLHGAFPDDQELIRSHLAEYHWSSGSSGEGPALWITLAGQNGHLPIHVEVPEPKPRAPDAAKHGEAGRYADDLWHAGEAKAQTSNGPKGGDESGPTWLSRTWDALASVLDWRRSANNPAMHFKLILARGPLTSGGSWLLVMILALTGLGVNFYCRKRVDKAREGFDSPQSPIPLPRPETIASLDVGAAVGSLLAALRRDAERLSRLSDDRAGSVYRHGSLLGIAVFTFVLMGCYAAIWGRLLREDWDWVVPVMLLFVVWVGRLPLKYATGGPDDRPMSRNILGVGVLTAGLTITLSSLIETGLDAVGGADPPSTREAYEFGLQLLTLATIAAIAVHWMDGGTRAAWKNAVDLLREVGRRVRDDRPAVRPMGVIASAPGFPFVRDAAATSTSLAQGGAQEGEDVPMIVRGGAAVGGLALGFLTFGVCTPEPSPILSTAMILVLLSMVAMILHLSIYLRLYWLGLAEFMRATLSLPMGETFDRLPLRLTSQFGRFFDAWSDPGDPDLDSRFRQVRENLETAAAADGLAITLEEDDSRTAETLLKLLGPEWKRRAPMAAFCDQGVGTANAADRRQARESEELPAESSPTSPAVKAAETYLGLLLVRFVNRHVEILWVMLTALTIFMMLLVVAVGCYPFHPAGTLGDWEIIVVGAAMAAVVSVLIGMRRSEFISRVNKLPVNRSIWNFAFLGEIATYVVPVVAVLAALSVSVSEMIRLVLGPLLP